MYTKILLAYDGSVEGRLALREGARLGQICRAEIFLLSVVSTAIVWGDAAMAIDNVTMESLAKAERETYEKILEEGVRRLTAMGLSPHARLSFGDPGPEIVKVAREINADLVVVGHRPQGVIARWLQGSVGRYLLDHLHCSMLVGRMDVNDEVLFARTASEDEGM